MERGNPVIRAQLHIIANSLERINAGLKGDISEDAINELIADGKTALERSRLIGEGALLMRLDKAVPWPASEE